MINAASPRNPLIYLVSKTKTYGSNGQPIYSQKLHVLSAASGAEAPNSPVEIAGSVPGTGEGSVNGVLTFNPLIQHSRAALLLVPPSTSSIRKLAGTATPPIALKDNLLFIAFASHGDVGPYHGWIFVYDADTLQFVKVLNTSPNAVNDPSGYPIAAGGIWQGGGGLASDGSNVYFATGNGMFDPSVGSFGDSIVRMDIKTLSFLDWFTPSNQNNLNDYDADLGSGAAMLLPSSASGSSGKKLLVQSGKEGTLYLMDAANLGKFHSTDAIWQELPYTMGGIWGCPAYFNNTIFYGPIYSPIVAFNINNGFISGTGPSQFTSTYYQYPGPTPAVSANGVNDGIVWAIQTDNAAGGSPAVLHAYDAAHISTELYNSASTQGRDSLSGAVKFNVPTVANGKVYVGTADSVGVFGLGTWAPAPTVTPAGGNYQHSVQVSVADGNPSAAIYYTTDGSLPTQSSNLYTGPVTLTQTTVFKARAYLNGGGASAVVENDYLIDGVIGSGTGLLGAYYDGIQDPAGTPTALRVSRCCPLQGSVPGGVRLGRSKGDSQGGEPGRGDSAHGISARPRIGR